MVANERLPAFEAKLTGDHVECLSLAHTLLTLPNALGFATKLL